MPSTDFEHCTENSGKRITSRKQFVSYIDLTIGFNHYTQEFKKQSTQGVF